MELLTSYLPPEFTIRVVGVAQSVVFFIVFCRSLFVLSSFFFWSLYCPSFHLLLQITSPLVSSNFSYHYFLKLVSSLASKHLCAYTQVDSGNIFFINCPLKHHCTMKIVGRLKLWWLMPLVNPTTTWSWWSLKIVSSLSHLMYLCRNILYNVNWFPHHPIKTRSTFLSAKIVFR